MITLQDCFDEFWKEEILGEDNAWYCPNCKEHRPAKKKLDIWTSPDVSEACLTSLFCAPMAQLCFQVLVIQLKRFSNSGRGMTSRFSTSNKIEAYVDAPVHGLDLRDVVVGPQKNSEGDDLLYDLFAVSNHSGYLGGGHCKLALRTQFLPTMY